MKWHVRARFLPVAFAGLLAAGCAAGASPSEPPASAGPTAAPPSAGPATARPTSAPASMLPATPSPTSGPPQPIALRPGQLPAGTYRTTSFEPTLTFDLDGTFKALFMDDRDEVAFEASGGFVLTMTRVSRVLDSTTLLPVDAPDDLVAWFAAHPLLTATTPTPIEIAGLPGQSIDVFVTNLWDLGIFAYETGNFRIPPRVTFRVHVLALDGPDLTIVVGGPSAELQRAIELAQPVLDSLAVAGG